MPTEYWMIGEDIVAANEPALNGGRYVFSVAFVCNYCGELWARRMLAECGDRLVRWMTESHHACPSCSKHHSREGLKMVSYREEKLENLENVPTAILAFEFLWLSLMDQAA